MKKWIAGGICFLAFIVVTIIFMRGDNGGKKAEPEPVSNGKSGVSAADSKKETPAVTPGGYTIKDYKGNIAVFEQGKEAPFRNTGIIINELPPADRSLLEKGINVSNQEELNLVLEDYCS